MIPVGGPGGPPDDDAADRARRLFRYLGGEEWAEYRAILAVFADTFFAEFTPDEVTAALAASGTVLDPGVVADRLERLRDWGNLTVSSSVGQPANLADYYRRRNRYLITRAGQEVHSLVEGVLGRADEVRDVSTGRLRAVRESLAELARADLDTLPDERLSDLVRSVFDAHAAFTDELTQFSASINQWQSRYDLTPDEFRFFAEVLVGYVAERLDEIERLGRPIARHLGELEPRLGALTGRVQRGLEGRVERAGLTDTVAVTRTAGSVVEDWRHLAAWFVGGPGSPSRLQRLTRDAVAAVRTLTVNLTRLSRVGLGASSRRADFLRLARILHDADPGDVAPLCVAAFGLHPARHLGVLADDAANPSGSATSWWTGPRAAVPVSLRERGDTTNRGSPSPVVDRSAAQDRVREQRAAEQRSRARVDLELLDAGLPDDITLSTPALHRLLELVGRSSHGHAVGAGARTVTDGVLTCHLRRIPGSRTVVHSPDGTLTLQDVSVSVERAALVAGGSGG